MISFDAGFFALAIPAVIFAGISKAGFGSGAAFAAAAILALTVTPGLALGVMLPVLMLIDVASLRPYWGKWDAPSVRAIAVAAIPGVALGALVYAVAPADALRLLIGVVCLAFVAVQIAGGASRRRRWNFTWLGGWITGFFAGVTSFVSHAGGPPVAVFLLGQGMGKTTYQATTVIVFWLINLFKVGPFAALGIFSTQTLTASLLLAPFALLGTWLGVRAHVWVSENLFFTLTYVLLTATGVRLIWVGLT